MATTRRNSAPAQTVTEQLIKSKARVRDLAEVYTVEARSELTRGARAELTHP